MEPGKDDQRARWRGLLTEQKESGQSIAAFCRDRALPVWQFYEWKKRLCQAEPGPFVAVEVVASETGKAATPAAAAPSAPIEIRLRGGHSLLVGPDFEAGHLCRLLRVLEQEA
jgi:hypothetical protein